MHTFGIPTLAELCAKQAANTVTWIYRNFTIGMLKTIQWPLPGEYPSDQYILFLQTLINAHGLLPRGLVT